MRSIIAVFAAAASLLASGAGARAATTAPRATPKTVAAYATVLHHINPQLPSWQSRDLAKRVLVNAERWRIDANMLVAIVTVESAWHTHAVSPAGAIGLGQLMPGTAASLKVNPRDPKQNLSGAARYLRGLMQRFGRHYSLVFAAYNAGPGRVRQWVRDFGDPRGRDITMVDWIEMIPFSETRIYVKRVLENLQVYRGQTGDNPSAFSLVADLAR